MARTFTIRDASGGLSVSLVNDLTTAASGINPLRGQHAGYTSSGGPVTKNLRLFVKATSHDNAASQIQTLIKLLDKAKYYSTTRWQREPVYLQEQLDDETNARFALVFGAQEQDVPDLFDNEFTFQDYIVDYGVSIVHEHPWRSQAPGAIGSPLTLTASSGSEASPNLAHVANFKDEIAINMVKVSDGGTFTTHTNDSSFSLFPATATSDDALYFGADDAWKHAMLHVGTAGNYNSGMELQVYTGSWVTKTLGTHYTIWAEDRAEITGATDLFDATGRWAINLFPDSSWTLTTIDSESKYWARIVPNSVTSWTTTPQTDSDTIYSQNKPYIELPAASMLGDSPPLLLWRMFAPSGGSNAISGANLSRAVFSVKSFDTTSSFTPFLNAGNQGNDSDWAITYGDDTSSSSDTQAPGGALAACTFASNSSLAKRVVFTGTNMLKDYEGIYRAYLRAEQKGGTAGDVKLRLYAYLGSNSTSSPRIFTQSVEMEGADAGPELVTFNTLIPIPFDDTRFNDSLDTTDLIFEVWAEQQSGSPTLDIYDLVLMPMEEGIVGLDDKNQGGDTDGTSALRGGNVLDEDMGVIANRTKKYLYDGTNLVTAESWARQHRTPQFANVGARTRVYFLLASYGNAWGQAPLSGPLGMHLAMRVYGHFRYGMLRGND